MKAWPLILTLLPVISVHALAQDTPENIADKLGRFQVVRGHFIQVREIAGVDGGLRSQGEYIFWRDHGIYLGTQLPLESAVTYRTDKTLQWSGDDPQAQEVNSRVDKHLRRILMAVFSFDLAQLERDFEQQWQIDVGDWELLLTPKQNMTAHFLDKISLHGNQHIQRVSVYHASGEVMTLAFEESVAETHLDVTSCLTRFAYNEYECEQFLDAANP